MSADAIEETLDHSAIDRLQRAYADVVDRRAWSELTGLFRPDAVVELDLVTRPGRQLIGPVALGGFVGGAMERFTFFQFSIVNSHVSLWPGGDRDAAEARVFICELRGENDPAAPDGPLVRSEAFGLYRDRYVRVDGRWWIAGRRYRSVARFPEGVAFGLPDDLAP